MKNSKKKVIYSIIFFIAFTVYFILKDKITINFSINNLREWVSTSTVAPILFVVLWIIRLVAVIPGMTLMILGGLLFSPLEAFALSLIGLVLSDSLIFLIGKSNLFCNLRNNLQEKHKDLLILINKYNYKFLALGVLCPVAPTDVICYLSSYLGLGYRRYILTFILANIPALLMYSYLGESVQNSSFNTIFIIITLVATGIISLNFWNKAKMSISTK